MTNVDCESLKNDLRYCSDPDWNPAVDKVSDCARIKTVEISMSTFKQIHLLFLYPKIASSGEVLARRTEEALLYL